MYSHLIPIPREGRHKNWPWGARQGSHYKVLELWLAFCLNNQIYISINFIPVADLRSVVFNWFLKQQEKHFTTNLSPWVVLKSGSITYCFDSWFLSWNNYTTKWKGEMKAISLPYIITIYIYYSIYYYLVFILIFTLLHSPGKCFYE